MRTAFTFFILLQMLIGLQSARAVDIPGQILSTRLAQTDSTNTVVVENLLKQGRIVVFLSHNCGACHSFVSALKSCSSRVQNAVVYASLSTSAQMEENNRLIVDKEKLFFVLHVNELRSLIKATPTTLIRHDSFVGVLGCSQLEHFIQKDA